MFSFITKISFEETFFLITRFNKIALLILSVLHLSNPAFDVITFSFAGTLVWSLIRPLRKAPDDWHLYNVHWVPDNAFQGFLSWVYLQGVFMSIWFLCNMDILKFLGCLVGSFVVINIHAFIREARRGNLRGGHLPPGVGLSKDLKTGIAKMTITSDRAPFYEDRDL